MENKQEESTEILDEWFLQELELIQQRIDNEDTCFKDSSESGLDWRKYGF
jgi:hypothetical protein